jgi:hypothetical protein
MLTVTPEAETWITSQLSEANAPEQAALRLFAEEGKINMGIAEPGPKDQTFEKDGQTFLAVGPDAAAALSGKTLCCQDTGNGASLAIAPGQQP